MNDTRNQGKEVTLGVCLNAEIVVDDPIQDGGYGSDSGPAAYSGHGGNAAGGDASGEGGLIDLFSGTYVYISSSDHA
jgi:hypothetical protein